MFVVHPIEEWPYFQVNLRESERNNNSNGGGVKGLGSGKYLMTGLFALNLLSSTCDTYFDLLLLIFAL